jgi:acyl-CoA thioester hydrolase
MFETPIIPRVSETDGAGHINNVFVPIWFEAGRREIFAIRTPTLAFSDWKVALVNMNVDYLAQIYFQHDAVVRTWIDRVGTKSFTVYEEISQRDKCCAKGTATYVYMNYVENRSEEIPADARSEFEKHLREP